MQLSIRVGYGLGQVSDGVKAAAFNTFLFFYFNQVLGLSGSLAGMAALLALVVDAVTDPMIGQYSDNFRSRWGRRHPFMLVGAIPFGLALIMLFSPPAGLGEMELFSWMLAWAIVVRVLLTLFYVPHLSLGAELVKDYHERTSLIGLRVFFSVMGSLVVSVVGFVVFFPVTDEYSNGMLNPNAYARFAIFCGILGSATMLISIFATRKTIPQLAQAKMGGRKSHPLLAVAAVFSTLKQKNFRVLFSTVLLFMIMAGVTQTLLVYTATYVFGFDPKHLGLLASSAIIGILSAPWIAKTMSRRFDKQKALTINVTVACLFGFSSQFLFLAGLFDAMSVEEKLSWVFLTNGISQGFFIAYVIIIDSMLTDIIDEHEMNTGRREEGLYFAARALAQKASYGLGAFFAGVALDIISFPTGASPESISNDAIINLSLLAGPISMFAFLMTIVVCKPYALNQKQHAEILANIEAARA
jgi:Na+/melibiose symporter-like transporter